VGIGVVVARDSAVDVGCADSAVKASDMRSGNRILDRTVAGEVGAKDFAWSEIGIGHEQRARQGAPKVRQHTELESTWQVCKAPKRKLVSAVQNGGSEIAVGFGIVERHDPEVLVCIDRCGPHCNAEPARILEPGQSVRDLQVQSSQAAERVLHILSDFALKRVVRRTSAGDAIAALTGLATFTPSVLAPQTFTLVIPNASVPPALVISVNGKTQLDPTKVEDILLIIGYSFD